MRLLRSTALVSAMTFISRVSGFVRDQVYAIAFGASPAMDAFFVAFRIPNFLRRLVRRRLVFAGVRAGAVRIQGNAAARPR